MRRFQAVLFNVSGAPLANTTVRVVLTNTIVLASIFNDFDVATANPLTTDAAGGLTFKVASGVYDLLDNSGNKLLKAVQIFDFTNPNEWLAQYFLVTDITISGRWSFAAETKFNALLRIFGGLLVESGASTVFNNTPQLLGGANIVGQVDLGNTRSGTLSVGDFTTVVNNRTSRVLNLTAWPLIVGNGVATRNITLTGVLPGDSLLVTPTGPPGGSSALILTAWILSANTVQLNLHNPGVLSVTPINQNWRFDFWRYN